MEINKEQLLLDLGKIEEQEDVSYFNSITEMIHSAIVEEDVAVLEMLVRKLYDDQLFHHCATALELFENK